VIQPVKLAQAYRYANTLPSACERRYASSYIAWMNGGSCGWQPAWKPLTNGAAQTVRMAVEAMKLWS